MPTTLRTALENSDFGVNPTSLLGDHTSSQLDLASAGTGLSESELRSLANAGS